MKVRRMIGTAVAALGIAGASLVAAPAAQAASYGYQCGTQNYHLVASHRVSDATVYLTQFLNGNQYDYCVVTVWDRTFIGRVHIEAWVYDNGWGTTDSGSYTSWAGPVYATGGLRCVAWGGVIGSDYWYGNYGC